MRSNFFQFSRKEKPGGGAAAPRSDSGSGSDSDPNPNHQTHKTPQKAAEKCLVIQPLPGIGDALWHLRAFRALARQTQTGKITLLAKPKSQVHKLLSHEPWVEEIMWLEPKHFGRMGSFVLGRELKEKAFDQTWILHHSPRYYIATSYAGIPQRHGYGFGWLKGMLTGPHALEKKYRLEHPITRYEALLKLHGLPLSPQDATLRPHPALVTKIKDQLKDLPRPWTVFGFGATNPMRVWDPDNFAQLAVALQKHQPQTIFLCGAKAEEPAGKQIQDAVEKAGNKAQLAVDFDLGDTCALLDLCDCFIGNDSGLLNLAGALGQKAYGLFGNLGVLAYNQEIFAQVLEKERDRKSGGMDKIQVKDVLNALKI